MKWSPSDVHFPPADWGMVVNRISCRPTGEDAVSVAAKARNILQILEMKGIPIINNSQCHAVGISKVFQAAAFAQVGVPSPPTQTVSLADFQTPRRGPKQLTALGAGKGRLLIKSNVGGYGFGIHLLEALGCNGQPEEEVHRRNMSALTDACSFDGLAILQEVVPAADGSVHRVEIVGDHVLYDVAAPQSVMGEYGQTNFNNCHCDGSNVCSRIMKPQSMKVVAEEEMDPDLVQDCLAVAKACKMEIGSLEYIKVANNYADMILNKMVPSPITGCGSGGESPLTDGTNHHSNGTTHHSSKGFTYFFIDINPVSTLISDGVPLPPSLQKKAPRKTQMEYIAAAWNRKFRSTASSSTSGGSSPVGQD